MIQKPEITKKLAQIAFWLETGWIVCNVLLIFLACVVPVSSTYSSWADIRIPLSLPVIYAVGQCCMIPFAWSCLRSSLQKELSENRAESNIALPSVLYFIGILLNWLIQNFGITFAGRVFHGADVLGAFSIRMQYQHVLNLLPVQTAALVLVCCAAAIEAYILKHKES